MKKYVIMFLVVLVVLALLVSCSTSQNGNNVNSSACEHLWVQNDAEQCEHLQVCTLCGEERGEDVLHVYFDESGNSLEKCLNCGKPNPQHTPPEKINTVTWQFNYTYWHEIETTTGEPSATLLVNDGFLGRGFNEIVIPEDITAGDTITIEYTGYIEIAESFPARIYLQDGEVISYSFSYAEVISYSIERISEMILDYDAPNNYVILDRSGKYTTLDEYKGEIVYFVKDQSIQTTENSPLYVACMLAYNPRDLEAGVPTTDNSTENMVFTKTRTEI